MRYLSKVLDINWTIEVTLAVLSSQEQAVKLVEGILEGNRVHPEMMMTAGFELQLSQAHGPFCAESSKDLLLKISKHIERL